MFSEFLQEQTRKLTEVIGDNWYYEDGDCYVPSNVQTIQALDKTNIVTVGLNTDGDGYMCHTSCLVNNEIVPYTLDEYHEEFCELRDDGKYYYIGGTRECGCQDKKSTSDLDKLVSEIVKNTVEGTSVPDDYDDLNDLVEQKVDDLVEQKVEDDVDEDSRELTEETCPRVEEDSRGLTGAACLREELGGGMVEVEIDDDEEETVELENVEEITELEKDSIEVVDDEGEDCGKTCVRKLLSLFRIGN